MNLEGRTTRLRALEPGDIDLMYAWENDTAVWSVSGTLAPFSRHTLERFIQEQQFDIFQTRQQRLGILIHDDALRGKGYASDAVETACRYAREVLNLHQLWCNVGSDNAPSRRLFAKAGFAEVGIKRDWLWRPGGYGDEILLQKILE